MRNRIGQILARKEWSEAKLARRSGIAQSYINRIKNRRINPTVGTALKLCRALGVAVEEAFIVDGEDGQCYGSPQGALSSLHRT